MSKASKQEPDDDLLPEYDLSSMSGAVRGKYYRRYRAGGHLALLEPEVAKSFPYGHGGQRGSSEGSESYQGPEASHEAAEQADADEVREGEAARPSHLIRGVRRTRQSMERWTPLVTRV
jgi:hypothetical protein